MPVEESRGDLKARILSIGTVLGIALALSILITPAQGVTSSASNAVHSTTAGLRFAGFSSFGEKGIEWQVFRFESTGLAGMMVGAPVDMGVSAGDEKSVWHAARQTVEEFGSNFGWTGWNAEIAQIMRGRGTTTALVMFEAGGAVVYGAYAAITFNRNGQLVSLKGRGYEDTPEGGFSLSLSDLTELAMASPDYAGCSLSEARYVWFPTTTGGRPILRAAAELIIWHEDPAIRPALFLDAETGGIIKIENRVVYEQLPGETRGSYRPFRPSDRPVTGPFSEEVVRLNGAQQIFSGIDGVFSYEVNPGAAPFRISSELRGRWVDVNYEDGADASFNRQIDRIEPVAIEWNRDNSRDDERMLYYHTNLIHSYWKRLDEGFRGMDRVIPATCEYGANYDNAFWNGQGMFFGNGPTLGNLALKGDVIHHEYGHGVTGSIYPWNLLPYEGESGALNEAWSDYFPCSISDEPFMGENNPGGAGALRNIDNNLVYPRDWFGEVHYDSRIISAAMWHSRAILGRAYADTIFHYARYELGNTFLTYFTDVLVTDDDDGDITNGTPNYMVLYEQFGRHGIGPGLLPKVGFSHLAATDRPGNGGEGDGDMIWEPGETIVVDFAIYREGSLYPPPAEDVVVTLSCDHPSVNMVVGEAELGSMFVGDTVSMDRALSFLIADDAPVSFAHLIITVGTPDHGTILADTIRAPLGQPELLLVRDAGEGIDRTEWYRNALDPLGIVYSEYSVATPHVLLDDWLERFQNVIWFTGDARDGFLSPDDRERIVLFIEGGGNIVLSGQSIGEELRGSGFLEENFGARVVTDSLNKFLIDGVENDPIGRGMRLLILGSQGAMNQRRPAVIESAGEGIECFYWTQIDDHPAAGVRVEPQGGDGRTLFLSFGIEGIGGHGGTNTRSDVMAAIMDWFGIEHGVEPEGIVVEGFAIGEPYPNPFNGRVSVPITTALAGTFGVAVYDMAGREVERRVFAAERGRNLLTLNAGGWGSGLYFLKVDDGSRVETKRVLLVQ